MPDIAIRETSRCTGDGCGGTPIWWVLTEAGKRMPLDVAPDPSGNVILVEDDQGRIRARVLTGPELPAQQEAWVPHWRTCPASAEYRRRRHAAAPKCRYACGVPMDPWLTANGYTAHPNCADPPTTSYGAAPVREALHPRREPEQDALDVDTAAARSWPDRRTPA